MGILSAVSGAWRSWRGGALDGYLRLDLTLFPASTGGPVLTTAGEFVGIASPVLSRIAPLAIPASTVERVASDLLAKGRVARGYLGVGLQPVPLPEHLKQNLGYEAKSAVIVLSVEPESPAERAGILIGDVLLSMGGKPLRDVDDLQAALEDDGNRPTDYCEARRGGKGVGAAGHRRRTRRLMTAGFGEIAERLRRSTVQVRSGRGGSGSGVVLVGEGIVITNAHVVRSNGIVIEAEDGRE